MGTFIFNNIGYTENVVKVKALDGTKSFATRGLDLCDGEKYGVYTLLRGFA